MSQPNRLAASAAHEFGGIELDRSRPLRFRLNGREIEGFAGDTVLTAALASGLDTAGLFDDQPIALGDRFAPLVKTRTGEILPIDRLAAASGLELATIGPRRLRRVPGSLGLRIDGVADGPWLRAAASAKLQADLVVIGGGVSGLAAALAAAEAGRSVVLVERRPWLGGDARYFGPVGDEENPTAVTAELIGGLSANPGVTVLTAAEAFAFDDGAVRVHQIEHGSGRVVAISADRILLATGSLERLPVFAGNRLPGIITAVAAYHLAKRYGVVHGQTAMVATQNNFGYRLALRLNDAGTDVQRVADARIGAVSRFIDFAKASGLRLGSGQLPASATLDKGKLRVTFADMGTGRIGEPMETDRVIVTGPFQPDLALWTLAGGGTVWRDGRLMARGRMDNFALCGAAAGRRSLSACVEDGRAAVVRLFDEREVEVDDIEIGAEFETPEAPAMIGPAIPEPPAFLDWGSSLISRPVPGGRQRLTSQAQAPSLVDVAASVDLGLIARRDAGAVTEERGAPGGELHASDWRPAAQAADELPAWIAGRFGHAPQLRHLIVDGKRRFERGALVYANTARPDPEQAIGVIVAAAPDGKPGGIAVMSSETVASIDRFIVETLTGPSPARFAKT